MPEIATAWVTLAVSAQGMERDIRRAMTNATRSASITPHLDTSRLSSQADRAGRDVGGRFGSAMKTAIAAAGIGVGIAGIASQFKKVMSVGMDWTSNMNTLQAVSGATADQLKKAGDAARALGNDISLPATSANDAASAMTELAKGGFSVQQSMDAAKGSLQLAAAAGISATEAATIQSQALQSFGLNAGGAGKMADTLANAANASSAEITDVAQALAQAGTVANQFGLSAEDTAASIALLANNGIKGSDAGTLLKSALLALTDQGEPAQRAIDKLGLTVYDSQGKFVGLHTLYGQLGEAAKKLTPEQYQAATATLFGSDAMRIAGVAAKDGSASYDQMRTAIDRQGAAADVAAAKTQGMPGALERVKNAMESLQLKAYDALQGPISKLLDQMSAGLGSFDDVATGVGPRIAATWQQIAGNPVIQSTWRETLALMASLGATAGELWPSLIQVGQAIGKASAVLGVSSWKILVTALEAAAGALNSIMPLIQGIAGFMGSHQAIVTTAVGAWLLFRTIPAILGRVTGATVPLTQSLSRMGQQITGQTGALVPLRSRLTAIAGDYRNIGAAARNNGQHLSSFSRLMTAVSNNSPTIRNMSNAFMGASTNVGAFTGALRAGVQPALNGLRTAASGVVGALGGPFSAALIAAGAAFAIISAQNQKADQSLKAYQDAVKRTEKAQVNLNSALAKSRGAFDDTVKGSAVERISAISDELEKAAGRQGTLMDRVRDESGSLWGGLFGNSDVFGASGTTTNLAEKISQQADAAKSVLQVINDLKMNSEDLTAAAYGPQAAFDDLAAKMEAAGNSGQVAAGKFRDARTEFLRQQDIARKVAPGVLEMATAMRTLADNTATAADKSTALKTALDALNPARTAGDAEAAHTRAVAQAQASETPIDAKAGIGNDLFKENGNVNTLLMNGVELNDTLKTLVDSTVDVATKGGDMQAALKSNDETFAVLAKRFQTDVPHIKAAFDTLGGPLANVSGKLSGIAKLFQDGAIPTDHPINVEAPGGQEVLDLLKGLGEKVNADNDKNIKVDAPLGQQTLQLLKTIGYEAKVVDNKLVLVKVDTAAADQAMSAFSNEWKTMTTTVDFRTPARMPAFPGDTTVPKGGRADGAIVPHVFGAIVPMADGGLQWIEKPKTAGIYSGRGAGTIFAEEETGGEAYIPLAQSKRGRSMAILMEVARLFGIGRNAEGSITVDDLKSYASGISGGSYVRGGPAGLTGTDCSGGQAAIANFITGANGRFATGNESQALLARGFQQGDPPPGIAAYWVGWKNGGPGGGHTAGTIMDPEGGNVNVEMGGRSGGGQYGGGAAGASDFPNRAWISLAGYGEDPTKAGGGSAAVKSAQASVTSAKASTSSAQNAVDKANADLDKLKAEGASADKLTAGEKKLDVAQQKLSAAQERQSAAETRLSEVKDKQASKAEDADSGAKGFGQNLASGMFGGLMESIGLPGFSNVLEWPMMKSGMALMNAFAGPLKGAMEGKLGIQQAGWSPGQPIGEDGNIVGLPGGGGSLPGIGMPGVGDFLKPIPDAGLQPKQHLSGAAPGPAASGPPVTYNMNGVDPKAGLQKADAHANQSYRRSGLPAVRPQ